LPIHNMQYAWKDTYASGIEFVDEQHKHFLGVFNEFDRTLGKYRNGQKQLAAELDVLCDNFLNYALYHFSEEEERFLNKCGCAICKAHIESHNRYRKTLYGYRRTTSQTYSMKLKNTQNPISLSTSKPDTRMDF
jgi:hemerythrin-like metal-binding protein